MKKFIDFSIQEQESIQSVEMESESTSNRDIAIVGMSVQFPQADSLDKFWEQLVNEADSIRSFPSHRRKDTDPYLQHIGLDIEESTYIKGGFLDEIDKFDYGFFGLSKSEAQVMDPCQRLFLQTAWRAMEDAGYGGDRMVSTKTGVYLGFTNDFSTERTYKRYIAEMRPELYSMAFAGNAKAIMASRISYLLDLKGPALVVDTTCSSSLVAVHLACQGIRNGDCDMALVGGVELHLLPLRMEEHEKLGIESSDYKTKPFDDESDGTGNGEGAAAILLKPLDQAIEDKDIIYAVIKGSAVNQDGKSNGLTAPSAKAQEAVLLQAWKDGGIDPATISYIEAHGTGTPLGDPIELEGLNKAFSYSCQDKQVCGIGSVKSNFGHLGGCAGIAGLIKSVLALEHKRLPASLHFRRPNRKIAFEQTPFYVVDRTREWLPNHEVYRCGVSSFGLSGTNCHVVMEEKPAEARETKTIEEDRYNRHHVFTLSAKSLSALMQQLRSYRDWLEHNQHVSPRDIVFSQNTGRGHYQYRLAFVFQDLSQLLSQVTSTSATDLEQLPDGCFYHYHEWTSNEAKADLSPHVLTYEAQESLNQEAGQLAARLEVEQFSQTCMIKLATLYTLGADIPWKSICAEGSRVRLPVYPFDPIRCWAEETEAQTRLVLAGREQETGDYTATEKKLAAIWSSVFGLERVHIYDNFYELGGDSIIAIRLSNLISEQFNQNISIMDLFQYDNIYDLARILDQDNDPPSYEMTTKSPNEKAAEEHNLSRAQYRMWFMQKMDPDSHGYHQQIVFETERLDMDACRSAMDELVKRHEALRTVFREQAGEVKQIIMPFYEAFIEMRALDERINDTDLTQLFREEHMRPFDFRSPAWRLNAYAVGDSRHCLVLTMHHIISDGWSMQLLIKEWEEIYKALLKGDMPALPAAPSYIDWVNVQSLWEESNECEVMEQYWVNELQKTLPVLELNTDYPRPDRQTYNGSYHEFELGKEFTDTLKFIAKKNHATLHMFLLSCYLLFLHKITRQDDIIVGVPIAGRVSPQWESSVGMFMNMICIRLDFSEIHTVEGLVAAVQKKSIAAYENGRYPFDRLVSKLNPERDLGRSPIFQTMFQFYENHQHHDVQSLYELCFLSKELDGKLSVRIEYNKDLFSSETVNRYADLYVHLLEQMVDRNDDRISDIAFMREHERNLVYHKYDQASPGILPVLPVAECFERQANAMPDKVAVTDGDHNITYGELHSYSNQIASLLRRAGVVPNEPVGLMLERGIPLIAGMMGILKAGGAYVPLDPSYPEERIAYMLNHSGARVLVCHSAHDMKVSSLIDQACDLESVVALSSDTMEIKPLGDRCKVYTQTDVEQQPQTALKPVSELEHLMYVIYTSGSTGKPKGVMVKQSNVMNFLDWAVKDAELGPDDQMAMITSISFDISVFEIFGALLSGATLHVISLAQLENAEALAERLHACKITVWHSVPTLVNQMVLYLRSVNRGQQALLLQSIRRFMIGGEAWGIELAKEIQGLFPQSDVINMYGPTEATIWASSYPYRPDFSPESGVLPIGTPISNNRMLILDTYGDLCPVGIPGEICITGANVTPGYYKDTEKTAAAFSTVRWSGEPLYRTGDIGVYLPDGQIKMMGRQDGLVKVRGYRIELGEIESVLLEHKGIYEVAVVAKAEAGHNKLICYYSGSDITEEQLKTIILSKLPAYMMPAHFVPLNDLPKTANGKVNRKQLASMELPQRLLDGEPIQEPSSEIERSLTLIWKELLGLREVGLNENFFHIGGNSLLLSQMHFHINERFPEAVKIVDLFSFTTISALSQYIESKLSDVEEPSIRKSLTMKDEEEVEREISEMFDEIISGKISVLDAVKKYSE